MLREFRAFYGDYIWMLPSGKADKEADLDIAAHRELREETGFDAKDLKKYFSCNQSDTIDITNHIYVGRDLFESPLDQDADELIEVHEVTLDEAIENIFHSPKIHTVSAIGLLRYMQENNL
jgi:ADP-ribose pyrophosphatase